MAKRRNKAQRWSPQDLPYQVDLFIEESWRMGGGGFIIDQLARDSHITWVNSDLVKLITTTASTMPDWVPAQVMTNSGFMAFSTPLLNDEHSEPVDALMWGVEKTPDGRDLHLFLLSRPDHTPGIIQNPNAPFGLVDHFVMDSQSAYSLQNNNRGTASNQPSRLIGTALLLANQPDIVTELTDESVTLPAKRRPLRRSTPNEHKTQLPDVKVRYLTVLPRVREDVDASEAEHAGLQRGALTQRHWVRGHWRQQPCGPGRTQIKPVYIKPHLRGPDDTPIDDRPSVNRMDR